MSAYSLVDVLEARETIDNRLKFPVPANWMQGRTTFGGFSSALMLATIFERHDGLPPLRSALINFTAPIGTPPTIGTEILRQGRNVTIINVRVEIEGKVAALGTFSFGVPQDSHVAFDHPAQPAPKPEETEPYFPPGLPRPPIPFLENFDVRLVDGALPFSGAERGYLRLWARHKDPRMWSRMEGLISVADLPPPAIYPTLKNPGPNSSMNWIFNVLSEEIETREGWFLLEHQLTAGHDGYSSQVMRVWNTDGDLIVDGMQSVIIFV
ncbi:MULTISPECIES: thioesterase family protein [unclassified Ruegeria]|uniref:thioesterase family protein n=1 Tax=unclassified Ruegeria TaxID=2625375 RepID=UPI0014879ADB|nr:MULTISPECIES: thioesterase family protein [unclassified Ruegeria]NOD63451.1 thioesterase family protein [Ruegeria sp. HKCCD6109]